MKTMPQITQKDRPIQVKTVLDDDELLLVSMTGTEQLSHLFRYELELVSAKDDLEVNDLLGTMMGVSLKLRNGETRHFSGHVSRFVYAGYDGDQFRYRATLVPWLWFLTRTTDCRIFQESTVLDIIKEVFKENDHAQFEERLSGHHSERTWEYCVQYRETDFNFVSRLMEQEGLYFYFTHEKNKHTLVLCDSRSSHDPLPGYEKIKYHHSKSHTDEEEAVHEWSVEFEFPPGAYALRDFNFKDPDPSKLLATKPTVLETPGADGYEMFDYPGEYTVKDEGDLYAEMRMQEHDVQFELGHGRSNARAITPGGTFELDKFRRDDQNREYLITSATYQLTSDLEGAGGEDIFSCGFTAINIEQQYRPRRTTPKPVVQGPQTAIVVGTSGEKVHVDEHGRVKVQFHWDREGANDENSSCWVRVSQNSAGKGWGSMFIPNLGHEVIVEFLEGDPDQPIITGRVYNNDNIPPRQLPSHKHESIIRDEFGNQIIFDSTPGEENLRLYSPHHDSSFTLGQSIKYTTNSDYSSFTIGNKYGITIGYSAALTLGLAASAFAGGKATVFVGASLGVWLGCDFTFTAGVKLAITFAGSISWNKGFSYTHSTAKQIESGSDTYTKRVKGDILIDSNAELTLVGGSTATVDDKCIIYMGPKKLQIGFGDGSSSRALDSTSKMKWQMFGLGALGVIAGGTAAAAAVAAGAITAQAAASAQDPENDPDQNDRDREESSRDTDWATVTLIACGAASLLSTIALVAVACSVFKSSDIDEPTHKAGGQIIRLTDKSVQVKAGKKSAMLWLKKAEETALLKAQKEVKIKSLKDAVNIAGKTEVVIKAKEVKAMKGKFTTKNIMDMG
jgi:type VI secretion system secreted protein VgrG